MQTPEDNSRDSRTSSPLEGYDPEKPALVRSPIRDATPSPTPEPIYANNIYPGPLERVPAKELFGPGRTAETEKSASRNVTKIDGKSGNKENRRSKELGGPPPSKIRKSAPNSSAEMAQREMMTSIAAANEMTQETSAQLRQQEQSDILGTVHRIEQEIARIVTMQNAQPGWVASSSAVLTTMEQHLRHASTNHHAIKHATALSNEILNYIRNNRVFNGALEEFGSELRQAKQERFTIREDLEAIKMDVAFLRSANPSAHMPSLAYPPTIVPPAAMEPRIQEKRQCIFCQKNHESVECRGYPSIHDKYKRASNIPMCTKCLTINPEKNAGGYHVECPAADIKCQACLDIGMLDGVMHNYIFCPLNETETSAGKGRRQSGRGRTNNQESHGKGQKGQQAGTQQVTYFKR